MKQALMLGSLYLSFIPLWAREHSIPPDSFIFKQWPDLHERKNTLDHSHVEEHACPRCCYERYLQILAW